MPTSTRYIYCDASFNKTEGLAVVGYMIFTGAQEHSAELLEDRIKLKLISESSNIRAELRAVIEAMDECKGYSKTVVIYTDCQNIVGLPARRKSLEHTGYMSGNTHQPLTNTDLYKEFYTRFEKLGPKLIWIKGHSPTKGGDNVRKNFSRLDRAVRKKLRDTIKAE